MSNHLPLRCRQKFRLRNPRFEQECSVNLDEQIELMTENLLRVQRQLTEEPEQEEYGDENEEYEDGDQEYRYESERNVLESYRPSFNNDLPAQDEYNVQSQTHENNQQGICQQQQQQSVDQLPIMNVQAVLRQKYSEYLLQNSFSQDYEQKINQLLDSQEQIMSIGNTIALFEMVFYFKEILTKEVLVEIELKAFRSFVTITQDSKSLLQDSHSQQQYTHSDNHDTQLLKLSLSQLIAVCGIPQQQVVSYYLQYLIEHPLQFQLSFNVLVNMGFLGISTLITVLNQDFQELTAKIFQALSRTQVIVQKVIVPQVAAELLNATSSTKDKNTALLLLTKIGQVAHSSNLLTILMSLFKSSVIDKTLLISAIKSIGKSQGERILIDLLHQPSLNQDIAVCIIKCLSTESKSKINLNIQICQYPIANLFQMNKLYFYQGAAKSCHLGGSTNNDTLYINKRMFSSLLEKLAEFVQTQAEEGEVQTVLTQRMNSFTLPQIITKDQDSTLPNLEIINLFLTLLTKSHAKPKIKQTLIESLGVIPLPQNCNQVVQKLSQCLSSADPSVLSTTCLALGKVKFTPSPKVIHKLCELLKNNFWKVRISACQAIGNLLRQPVQSVIETLIKCLKDGSINRQLVCQTLIRIHPICEQLLIQILKQSKDSKIQQIILCSFNEPQIINSDNFGAILETVFQFSNSKRKQLRYICIGVANSLRKHAMQQQNQVLYFKPKNILPFYFNFLDDPCPQIRDLGLAFILEFGSHAELILIEGMTKGKINCKIQCAKGLGQRGVQNFRALLLGMRDINEKVRRQCSESILNNFSIDEIQNEYKHKQSQRVSLVYNIKDLMEGSYELQQRVKPFMQELMSRLSGNLVHLSDFTNEEKQIEKEINEFRKTMRAKNQNQQKTNFRMQEIEDIENINPNICMPARQSTKSEFSKKEMLRNQNENFCIKTKKTIQKKQSQQRQRYYLKLNDTIF